MEAETEPTLSQGAADLRKLVIGLGNRYRGDDAVGLLIAEKLMDYYLWGAEVIAWSGEASTLMDLWENADQVIIIDAAASGGKPGNIYRFNPRESVLPREIFPQRSTHSFSVADAIELARELGKLPKQLTVISIEGGNFEAGEGLSLAVEQAAVRVVNMILIELGIINPTGS